MPRRPARTTIDPVDTQRTRHRTRTRTRARARDRPRRSTQAAPLARAPSVDTLQHPRPPDLDELAARWQRALDAGESALHAAAGTLPASYLGDRRRELVQERKETAELLRSIARARGTRPLPWLSPVPVRRQMLGLTAPIRACLFDLDGVLTDSARLHASAWAQVFDEFLLRLAASTGWQFTPFDSEADYRTYIDGRSRLEGIHAFLESRGIRLPEGRVDDSPTAQTACGLAVRKGEALERRLVQRGVTSLPGVHRYLDAAGRAGLTRAVISASASTLSMLDLAGLAGLVEVCVDAEVIRSESIRTPPAPDLLLAACERLGVPPHEAVTFTHSAAGVVAGRRAGSTVVGVAQGADGELLRDFGAERVVTSLSTLLDPSLAEVDALP
jgi:beta-phosphoglucomutase-like phosphatase (HAD superfamily)